MATVEATTSKVQRILAEKFQGVQLTESGFVVHHGSTGAFVDILDWGDDKDGNPRSIVRVGAPVARGVKPSPDLYRWAATEGQQNFFGSIRVIDEEAGTCFLAFEHALLGDFLDPAELESTVALVLLGADDFDDLVVTRFGGKRYVDE